KVQAQDLEELLNRLSELPQAPQQEEEDAPLPEIAGNITIENSQLLFTDTAGLVRAFGLAGEVRIPSINQPITHDLTLTASRGDTAAGRVVLAGQVDAIENNLVALETLSATQTWTIDALD